MVRHLVLRRSRTELGAWSFPALALHRTSTHCIMGGVPEKVLNWLYSVLPSVCLRLECELCHLIPAMIGIRRRKPHVSRRCRGTFQLHVAVSENRSLQCVCVANLIDCSSHILPRTLYTSDQHRHTTPIYIAAILTSCPQFSIRERSFSPTTPTLRNSPRHLPRRNIWLSSANMDTSCLPTRGPDCVREAE